MEYERIHKVQTGIISPSKIRMKLMGSHNRKKDGCNNTSARTSPSKIEESEFVKNSLLASNNASLDDEVKNPSLQIHLLEPSDDVVLDARHSDKRSCEPKETVTREDGDVGWVKLQHVPRGEASNPSTAHTMRMLEDETLDYDSNASSSSFEFHEGERSQSNPVTRSISRPMPSKWNDAEKWIMNRKNLQTNYTGKNANQSQADRLLSTNMVRVAPELATYDQKLPTSKAAETKGNGFCQLASQMEFAKFPFTPAAQFSLPQSKDLEEVNCQDLSCTKYSEDKTAIPGVRSVCMRDMGTEMTPFTSQEPSQTATPASGISPLRSPSTSMPSTPCRARPAPKPLDLNADEEAQDGAQYEKKLSEEELKLKTRREIVALGVQLGKMNIAAWASKYEQQKNKHSPDTISGEELERIEFAERAAAWEEAEKSKHMARYKREEIKIQSWESQQKAKLEAEMQRIEAQVDQFRAQTQAKMVHKIAMTRQISEAKRAAAEARWKHAAERTSTKAECIRQTGRMPPSHYMCCGWRS